jgi:hypothetical protein
VSDKNSATLSQPPSLAAFCLIIATYTIEQYCKRRLLYKKLFGFFPFYGDCLFPLRDYPVREVLVENDFYHTVPECGEIEDIPFSLSVSLAVRLSWTCWAWNMTRYRGGGAG